MADVILAYPLQWPAGWRRIEPAHRTRAKFSTGRRQYSEGGGASWMRQQALSVADARGRVLGELQRMGVPLDDAVISTNIPLRLDGLPRGDAREPADPAVAVYWRHGGQTRCMAIDRYDRAADNMAAIAATLEAMRSI